MRNATLPGVAAGTVLGPGSVVSGRFQIENLSTLLGQIVVYSAKDQRTQRAVALWAVPPGLLRPEALAATRNAVKAASAVSHKDLVVPFGSSTDPSGTLFIATEPLGAMHVGELIKKKSAEGHVHGLNAAYQLLAHAMNGLAAAHAAKLAHGAIIPTLLRVDEAGHVRLAGVGLVAPLVASGAVDQAYVAPEVRKGGAPTARSDVYSLGAMLYELCTGKAPNAAVPATSLQPSLPTTFDIIIENCLAENPDDRFESVTEMKGALASLVAPTVQPPPSEGLDVPIEFDEDIDVNAAIAAAPPKRLNTVPPATGPARAAPAASPAIPGPPRAPAFDPMAPADAGHAPIGARISMAGAPPPSAADEPRMSSVDLKGLLDEATANDAPRWMFVRGGLDHGPLSARELIQAIVRNEVLEDDVVFNMDSGERRKLVAWPQYREFAEQAREKRKKDQHAREVRSAIAEDTVSTRAKGAVAVAAVFMAALIGVVYYKTLSPTARQARRQAELDDALARGQIRMAEGGLQVLEAPRPESTGGGGGRRSGGGGGGGGGSYEAAMNQPIEFNFGGSGPGGGTLSDREISAPLNAQLGRFGSCATAEIARGGSARQVQMRIAVAGNGAPIGVTVVSGSPAFKGCVAGIVRSTRWRAFGGPRIGFAWGFSLQ